MAVADPAPTGTDRSTCLQLMAALPPHVLGLDRRQVRPGVFSAGWGRPVITLRCGVSKPPRLNRASPCFGVNGVGWFAEETAGGYLFTTIGRQTYVEVGVPTAYAPEGNALVDVAAAVKAHDPLRQPCR